ncbi:MAG: murein biosynthesis integral membrane protein MurJ [Ardenticatenales bacterium]|nr:murein biosynthesis integral membrane protein MurJ [Ardenticatenales bacterium]
MSTSRNSRVARAAIIVMAGFLASKVAGLVRQLVIARVFGATGALDAYFAAFTAPDIIFTLISGGALATAFIPVFSDYTNSEEPSAKEAAWRMASNILTVTFALSTVVSLLTALLAPWLVAEIIAPGFSPEQQIITVDLMRLALISTIIFSISGLVGGVLYTLQHFLLPAFAGFFYNVGIILCALFLVPRMPEGQGVYALVIGSIIGALLHLAIQLPAVWHFRIRLRPLFDLSDPGLRQVAVLMGPRALALGLINAKLIIKSNLASRLDPGSLSALDYAWDLMQLPETIFATAVATAVFPTLAELAARKAHHELATTFNQTIRTILALTVPAAVGLLVLGSPIVRTFYEGGNFSSGASEAVSYALSFFAFGIVGHGLLEVVARLFYAQKDTLRPLYAAIIMLFATGSISWLLLEPLGIGGIALGDTLGVFVEVGVLLWWLRALLPEANDAPTLRAAAKIALASTAMAVVLFLWLQLTSGNHIILVAGGGILLGAATYGATALLLGLEEVKLVPRLVLRRGAA